MVSFEGYADDCGVKVASVEFSMDGGETWTSFDTSSSNAEDWVYWHFDYVAETAGTFKLDVPRGHGGRHGLSPRLQRGVRRRSVGSSSLRS